MHIRKSIIELYLDYVNNYLTIEKFAEHKQILVKDAEALLALGKKYFQQGFAYPEFDENN